ncbi:DHHW family protein [Mobilibacterium timonense]|uniref:DHHW family protein n=1 Tax=Mobilibacterium timonense TaxID=1871012 RepID=UPI001EEC3EF7|nr:DHHW family protein [Mobilibacterium timonense]
MDNKGYYKKAGICFIVMVAAIVLLSLFSKDRSFSDTENRALQQFPGFSISQYMEGRFEKRMESYADDQFPGRDLFVKIKSAADVTAGGLEANGVYKGRDGYLIEDVTKPDRKSLSRTEKALADFKARHSNVDMYFLLAPTAGNIMSDKLPRSVRVADQDAYMDQFFKSVQAGGINTIDVRSELRKAADKGTQVYYRTDHHWTTTGAYLAYQKAAPTMGLTPRKYRKAVVSKDFRGTLASKSGFSNGKNDAISLYLPDYDGYKQSVIFYDDTQTRTTKFYRFGNLKKKDQYTVFGGSNHPKYTIKTPVESKERLLIVKDSYANCFIPFLTQDYFEIVVVDPRYYFENIDDLMDSEGITKVLFLYNSDTFFGDDSLALALEQVE